MGCAFLLFTLISPRAGIIFLWAFTNYVDRATDSFIAPLLGLIFLPWTTLLFILVAAPAGGISFFGWLFVLLGIMADLTAYSLSARNQMNRTA